MAYTRIRKIRMMSTVRISAQAKSVLKGLQDAWEERSGEAPTQAELLEAALGYLERDAEAFLDAASWRPWTPSEIHELRSLRGAYGTWSVADADEILYGDDA